MTGIDLKAALATVLIAFGIAVPLPALLAGLCLGQGCCYAVMIFTPPADQKSLWATLFVGFLSALLVAIGHPHTQALWLWGALPLQIQMAAAGALSRSLAEASISLGQGLIQWARDLPSKIKLPGDPK